MQKKVAHDFPYDPRTYVQKYSYFTLNPSMLGEVLNSDFLSHILTAMNEAVVFILRQT